LRSKPTSFFRLCSTIVLMGLNFDEVLVGANPTISLQCPGTSDPPLVVDDWDHGGIAMLGIFEGTDVLCTLIEVEMDIGLVTEDGTITKRTGLNSPGTILAKDFKNLKPVGRSYNGNDWEAAPGDYSSLSFDCSERPRCSVRLPKLEGEKRYVLKSYDYGHELTPDDLTARFLERATFGPTKADIASFTSPDLWMEQQLSMTGVSHRRVFRERVTDWFYYTSRLGLLHAGPCESGSRYRNSAFTRRDAESYLHVRQSPLDDSKLILLIGGQIRTVVNAPMSGDRRGNSVIDIDTEGKIFYISKKIDDSVGGKFTLKIPLENGGTSADSQVYFGGVPGNPLVWFDEAHAEYLENLIVLPNGQYSEVPILSIAENTRVLQLTENIPESYGCAEASKELVGLSYPPKATIARTTENGQAQYWIHSPTLNLLNNDLDTPLADGGKDAVDRTANPPQDLDKRLQAVLKAKCSNAPRTFLNEESCTLSEKDACSYDETADIGENPNGKVLVCGSPGEAATKHDLDSGTLGSGGFMLHFPANQTQTQRNLREQRLNVWAEIALRSKDQLRQKMAYALSQILVISDDVGIIGATENVLSFYDIFVRNAFGNYFNVLKEVTLHPMMAEMLTYQNGQSTGYAYINDGYIQQADENFAREIMQLFTIGVVLQNDDGTLQLDGNGNEIATYTNFDISEYAKVYVGLVNQAPRGNIETSTNEVDPLRVNISWKDQFPKLGLNSKYIGDGYPLCADIPHLHFLKKGAKYRILGAKANPDFGPESWMNGFSPKRVSLNLGSSNLASILCNKNEYGDCNPQNIVLLPTDIECDGIECEIEEPRTIEVAKGLWYEYIRPPCVNEAFYNNGKSIYRISEGKKFKQILCGNPSLHDASTTCCEQTSGGLERVVSRKELFGGERTNFETAEERCFEDNLELCNEFPKLRKNRLCAVDDACDDDNVFYWLSTPCSMSAKISPEGNVAIVHSPTAAKGEKANATFAQVSSDNKSFFRVDWRASDAFPMINNFLDSFDYNCKRIEGCFVDNVDGSCQCEVSIENTMAFNDYSDLKSVDNLLSIATIGAFVPVSTSFVSTGTNGIKKSPSGSLAKSTIFEVTDSIGRTHYRKNILSIAKLGDGALQMRNPVTFWSLPDVTIRDGEYELDAALEHYFFHPNVPSFLAKILAQRFGSSNPSPRYIKVIANAFKTGKYRIFGSNEYGCLEATIAAIVLDREAQDHILDADPIQGQLQGPYMRLMKAMRASEYKSDPDNPILRFFGEIIDAIGEEPHKMPSVFSFFGPDYISPGRARAANMFAPEAQVLNSATSVSTANGLMSLFKYGLSQCGDSFFGRVEGGRIFCIIGDDSTNFGNNKYNPSTYGLDAESADDVVDDLATLLTSGRLSPENRQIIKNAFRETLSNGVTDDPAREALINAQQLIALSPEFHSNSLARKRIGNREPSKPEEASGTPYKAVIHVMLSGGLDSFNVLVPESCTGTNSDGTAVDAQYLQERGTLAFDRSKGEFDLTISPNTEQPCERFAIHEELPYIKELYDDQDLLFFANVGVVNQNGMNRDNWDEKTQSTLFAHDAMQEESKKVDPYDVAVGTGVWGRLNDLIKSKFNGIVSSMGIVQNSVVLAGNPSVEVPISIVGRDGPVEFGPVPDDEKWFDIEKKNAEINSEHDTFSSIFGATWSEQLMKGINEGDRLTEFIINEENVDLDPEIWDIGADEDKVSRSFQTLSKLIQTRVDRKVDRDTFTIGFSGFDHHANLKAELKDQLVIVNKNLKRLIEQLKKDGIWDQVTVVVASEFGRTISPNSNAGSDHGWGGNYMIMGGSINGGRVLGKYPDDLTSKSRLNASRNTRTRLIPTMSWEHMYNGVVEWMADGFKEEITEDDLDYVLPNRINCIDPVEGEGSVPLFRAENLYGIPVDCEQNLAIPRSAISGGSRVRPNIFFSLFGE